MIELGELDALLRRELAPPEGPTDMAFVARIDRTIVEAELYRAARARVRRQTASDALAAAALAGSVPFAMTAPGVREALSNAPGLAWTGLLALLLCWLLIMKGRLGAPG